MSLKPAPLALALRCDHKGWKPVAPQRRLIRAALEAALAAPPVQPMAGAEVSVLLTGDARMREINRNWRSQDRPTNVLSFPAAPASQITQSPMLGDIVIAFETVEREAHAENKAFGDHLAHLVIHGFYHLLGDDHESDRQARVMEARETSALARLGINDPYRDPAGPV